MEGTAAKASSRTFHDVRLVSGEILPEATIAYHAMGKLNAAGDNAVLVLHGYTTGPSMLEAGATVAEGSWSELVGPERAIDTERYFVVCPNMLGSSFGSTGPGSINPRSGKPYGADFPRITVKDIVATQALLVEALGIRRLAAAIGPSYGGYQALQWALSYPDFVERVVMAVSAPANPQSAGVQYLPMLTQLQAVPGWNHGLPPPGAMLPFLTQLRIATLRRCGVEAELAPRFPDKQARDAELQRLAREWAEVFDAGSLVVLARAAGDFDARADLGELRAPLLWVLSRTDAVFPPALAAELAPLLDEAGVRWSYFELDSEMGHLASGADAALWVGLLREFMETPPGEWRSWGLSR